MYKEYHKQLIDVEVVPYHTFKEKLQLTNKYKNGAWKYRVQDLGGILYCTRLTADY